MGENVSGLNYQQVRSTFNISQDVFNQLDALDGSDGQVGEAILGKAKQAMFLAKGNVSDDQMYNAMMEEGYQNEQQGGILRKIIDIIKGALGIDTSNTQKSDKIERSSNSDNTKKSSKADKQAQAELEENLQKIADTIARRITEAAQNGDNIYDDKVFDLTGFNLGSSISGIEFNPDFSDSSNDTTKVKISEGKVETTLNPDGLQIVVTFNVNGQTYSKTSTTRDPAVIEKLQEEEVTVNYEKDIHVSVGGSEVN